MPKPSRARRAAPARRPQRQAPPRTHTPAAVAAILLCGLLAYANSFAGVFVFDDEPAIVENPHIRQLWPLSEALAAPRGTTVSGRPVVSLTLALNHALAPAGVRDALSLPPRDVSALDRERLRRNLRGYHALNLAVHLATALALFGIVRRTLWSEPLRHRFGPPATALAFATALLWTVHPLQTASVTYVIQRAESLMAMFLALTLYCAIRGRSGSRWWTAGAAVSCALGMGSKETMIVAPLVVALWDWTFAAGDANRRPRLPLYVALAGTWVILALLVSGNHRPDAAGFGFAGWPWWRYLITQAGVIAHYLRLAVFPFPLVLDYGWPAARVGDVLPQLVLLIGLVAASAWGVIRRRPWGFAAGAFFLVLAPTSSILPIVTEVAAEHRMYLPLASMLALIVVGGHALLGRWRPAAAGRIGALAVGVLTVAGVSATYARNADYHDADRIWLDTILRRPLNARARTNYATALLAQGRFSEAEAHVRVAVQVEPTAVEAQQTLGVAMCAQSRCGEGLPHLEVASRLAPSSPEVWRNLGEAYASLGRRAEAAVQYQRALALRPDDLQLLNRAGWILATDDGTARDGARAVRLAGHAVRLSARRDVESLDTLAAAYAEVGRFEDAMSTAAEALRLAPSQSPAMLPELEQRLALYRTRRAFRQK